MTGFCPNGTGPPACVVGPKWTSNDPLFFMHHGVRVVSVTFCTAFPFTYRPVVQMVDKVWYDWQKKGPKNQYSYGGGSVEGLVDFKTFSQFPTGLPPYLDVSASSDLKRACAILVPDTLRSPVSV